MPGSRETIESADRTPPARLLAREGYIVSPWFDLLFFIGSPLLGLVMLRTIVLTDFQFATARHDYFGIVDSRLGFGIAIWTYAHLFAVVFRSHLNGAVFRQHRIRFTLVPIALFLGLMVSPWVLAIGVALTWLWDIYHSSMQIFGFSRIYDSRLGNSPDKGRTLDMWMAHFIYIAPVFVGLSLQPILRAVLGEFRPLGYGIFYRKIDDFMALQPVITAVIVSSAAVFVGYYIMEYRRLCRDEGYRYSPQKAVMLGSTGIASIYAWGFLHPAGAFFVVNFFHALQYFAMVWWSERANLTRSAGLSATLTGHAIALGIFVLVIFGVGTWHKVYATHGASLAALSLAIVITLMHFWYDGFIWSVRKHAV